MRFDLTTAELGIAQVSEPVGEIGFPSQLHFGAARRGRKYPSGLTKRGQCTSNAWLRPRLR
jgi:hypothetical protein